MVSVADVSDGFSYVVISVVLTVALVVVVLTAAAAAAASDDDSVVIVVVLFTGFFFLVNWVHPPSRLLWWSPGSRVALVVGPLVLSLLLLLLLILLLAGVFWGQVLAKYPSCLQDQQSNLLPSTTTIICWSLYVRNGVKALLVEADVDNIITVCRPIHWSYGCYLLYTAVRVQVGSEDIPI